MPLPEFHADLKLTTADPLDDMQTTTAEGCSALRRLNGTISDKLNIPAVRGVTLTRQPKARRGVHLHAPGVPQISGMWLLWV
jgi:hypothetical protein